MRTAAGLIKAEIDDIKEDRTEYPNISDISCIDKQIRYVPFLLRTFLYEIFKCRKTDMQTRIAAVGQSIMQNYRPKTLMAPMQFALTMRVHDDCPGLLDILFKNGFSLSDHEARLFKSCAASYCPDPFSTMDGHFGWIIGDNFDHNKITLTGHDTMHVMALMMTKTPSNPPPHRIPRDKKDIMDKNSLTRIDIKNFSKFNPSTETIIYKSIPNIVADDNRDHLDILWKISLAYKKEKVMWQGYMTAITKGNHTGKASYHFLPMVDLDPNSWKCIYSVLMWAENHCRKYDIVPVFTFDQPIWWNARQIKSRERKLDSIVLNLGGFHTDLSFLGTIGNIMKSSGLKQMLTLVYPENTVNHMLNGKAYYRAMRGLFLVDAALNIFIIENYFPKNNPKIMYALEMFNKTMKDLDENKAIYDKEIAGVEDIYKEVKEKLKNNPTGMLWVQFMDLIDLIRVSHRAQRTNDFMLFLKSLQMRLPYFPASGHNNYAMSVHIFLQDMLDLKDTNPRAYNLFNSGYFFVRRSDRFWAAIPSDLVIEQVLMASLKDTKSGLTHGRGLEEIQRLNWLYSRPAFAHIKLELDQLYNNDNQHINKELTNIRIKEDNKAIHKIHDYIKEHNPFKYDNQHLVDISTGISYPNANAHKASEIGSDIVKNMIGVAVKEYTFRKKDRIKPMGEKVNIGKEDKVIDVQLFFQRCLVLMGNPDVNIDQLFEHELSVYPTSLYNKNGHLRSADDKAALTNYIANECKPESTPEDKENLSIEKSVLDMGSKWRRR